MNPETGEADPLVVLCFLGMLILVMGIPALIAFVEWAQS